nr:caspase family protein [Ardenticatena sp.]
MSSPEKTFEAWARRQAYEMQRRALLRQLQRMQWLEFLAYVLAFAWVLGMFVAFQMGRVGGDIAGIVTAWALVGGAFLAWLTRRRQAQVQARLAALDAAYADVTQEATMPEQPQRAVDAGTGFEGGGTPTPTMHALVIGIDEYAQPHVPDLQGCVADALAVRDMLVRRFGVAPEHITLLTNEAATREGILNAFEQLVARTRPGDRVYVHYSGHGSQMRDVHGDEPDGRDETIVPHDSRDPEGRVFDITDDELFAFVQRLQAKTSEIVLVFDCCHSGSITREMGTVRRLPMDEREPPAPPPTRSTTVHTEGVRGALPTGGGYVLVSGCRAEELSNEYEVPLSDGRTAKFGALTYHLVRALLTLPADTTWRQLIEDVGQQVNALFANQHPVVEGDIERAVFGRRVRPRDAAFMVTAVAGKTLTIDAGGAHGLRAEMPLAIYAPDVETFAEAEPVAQARVQQVETTQATAVQTAGAVVPVGARVRPLAPPVEMRLPVVLDESALGLAQALQAFPWIQLTDARTAPSGVFVRVMDGRLHLETITGRALVTPFDASDVAGLHARLEHMARYRQLALLDNPDPASLMKTTLGLSLGLLGANERVQPLPPAADGTYQLTFGQNVVLTVQNSHPRPVFITLLTLNGDFSVQPFYPPPGAVDNRLDANRSLQLGLKGELTVSPPEGKTTVLLLATEQPSDFRSLIMAGLRSLEATHPLERLLNESATRGLTFAPATPVNDDWTAKRLTFYARPA